MAKLLQLEALDKQMDFVEATEPEVLYSGAYGAGKSAAVCMKVVAKASRPGARVGLVRKTFADLRATTLVTLLDGDGQMPPILPAGWYDHNKSEKIIRLHGGGVVTYFGLDEQRIGSRNLSDCGVDECAELTKNEWEKLGGRIRVDVGDGVAGQLFGACNPDAPSHFLAERFGIAAGHEPLEINGVPVLVIQTTSLDNPFLPAHYQARLATFTGVMRLRYVLGKWVAAEGDVYDRWLRETHVMNRPASDFNRWWIAVDYGYNNPFAALLVGEDSDGRLHVAREFYARQVQEVDQVNAVRDLLGGRRCEAVIVDPSAGLTKGALRKAGYAVVDGDNVVNPGIAEVSGRMLLAGDGKPRLTVATTCTRTYAEHEGYVWDKDKEKPLKVNDHTCDALRYLCMHIRNPIPIVFDAKDLDRIRRREAPCIRGTLGAVEVDERDRVDAFRRGEPRSVRFHDAAEGNLAMYCTLEEWEYGWRPQAREYNIFGLVGEGQSPSYIAAADIKTRSLAALWIDEEADAEKVAEMLLMLGIWFGSRLRTHRRALAWWSAMGPGAGIHDRLRFLKAKGLCTSGADGPKLGWHPKPADTTAAVIALRDAVAADKFKPGTPIFADHAGNYVWNRLGQVVPAQLADDPEQRGTWADSVLCLAGLWEMTKRAALPMPNEPEHPDYSPYKQLRSRR